MPHDAPSKTDSHQSNNADVNALGALVLPPKDHCFHCGDPVPKPPFYASVLDAEREMCCMGCQLAAESIVEAGLEQYYLDRSEINRTAAMPNELTRLQAYDNDDIKAQFVYADDGKSVAELSVNNLRCAACTWLIESRLYELDGVAQCQVNLTSQRMRVIWDESKLPISQILMSVNEIGYEAKPYRQDTHEAMLARANKTMLIRLGIAALGAMQAMMYAVGMYFGEYSAFGGMLTEQRDFFRWVSLFVSIPVFFYCAIPFFSSALSAIKARQVNMDVPVSLALIVTFFASLYATVTGHGETYYDSVSMFVFFLLAGRYIEHNARLKAANLANDLVVVEPILVQKVASNSQLANELTNNNEIDKNLDNRPILSDNSLSKLKELAGYINKTSLKNTLSANSLDHKADPADSLNYIDKITAQSLKVGDVIVVEAGSEIIADGVLCSEVATVSQSLLTGESDLIVKTRGDAIIGGSQNDSQPFVMIVTALAEDSQIALIDRLMNRALSEKPKIAEQADHWARWFVARILVLSVAVFIGWYLVDPSEAIWATVAVLVATCPCALSLATPIALTVSTNRLAYYGFLTTRGHTLQTLAGITHVAFDKTGTLTYGKPTLLYIDDLNSDSSGALTTNAETLSKDDLLAIAAAMEVGSRHPIAKALLDGAYQLHLPQVDDLQFHPAGGLEATVNHSTVGKASSAAINSEHARYRLGHVDFALERSTTHQAEQYNNLLALSDHNATTAVMLSVNYTYSINDNGSNLNHKNEWQPLAIFYFNDSIREGARDVIDALHGSSMKTVILTGDPSEHAHTVAKELGIDEVYNGLSPLQKVNHIKQLQTDSHSVMMVGDGINDAPVLAAANVSTALAGAADLAQVSSDSVILNGRISAVKDAKRIADQSQSIIKQNLYWALGYNGVVLIPAALGFVPPWLAAIGMSFSSLVVVLNALRLKRA